MPYAMHVSDNIFPSCSRLVDDDLCKKNETKSLPFGRCATATATETSDTDRDGSRKNKKIDKKQNETKFFHNNQVFLPFSLRSSTLRCCSVRHLPCTRRHCYSNEIYFSVYISTSDFVFLI